MSAMTDETWWRREIVTAELDECCDLIAAGLGIDRSAVGTKGNEAHRRGHHRSQEWIKNSLFCTSRTYTVQAGLTAAQARHIAGIDYTPGVWGTTDNRRRVAEATARVIAEMKAGRLDIVIECYGAAPGLKTVTGYNNRENREASSDLSHLDHGHLGLDRTKLTDRAALLHLAAVVIGDDMATVAEFLSARLGATGPTTAVAWQDTYTGVKQLVAGQAADEARDRAALAAIQELTRVIQAGGGDVDSVGIIDAIRETAAAESERVTELLDLVGQLRTDLADRDARLAEALTPAGS